MKTTKEFKVGYVYETEKVFFYPFYMNWQVSTTVSEYIKTHVKAKYLKLISIDTPCDRPHKKIYTFDILGTVDGLVIEDEKMIQRAKYICGTRKAYSADYLKDCGDFAIKYDVPFEIVVIIGPDEDFFFYLNELKEKLHSKVDKSSRPSCESLEVVLDKKLEERIGNLSLSEEEHQKIISFLMDSMK